MNIFPALATCLFVLCWLDCVSACAGQTLPVRSLAKGVFSGVKEARQEVIKEAAQWEKLWKQHGLSANSAQKIPAVDFSKEMVIVATMGVKRTGGYAIEIAGAEVSGQSLKISVKQSSPPPGALTIQALTAPFHFVAAPKSDLKPEFVEAKAGEKK